jgi:hypothetical protein
MSEGLRKRTVCALEAAHFESFIGPLTRRGFMVLEEERDAQCLSYIEQRFGKPVRDGVVLFPCGFGDWGPMKEAAKGYVKALKQQGMTAELLLIQRPWDFAAYVYIRPELAGPKSPVTGPLFSY